MSDKKAVRRIHKFNFDKETMIDGSPVHVALVDRAANLTEVMTMKASKHVTTSTVTESFDEHGYEETRETMRISDYGDEMVRVTNETYTVKEEYIKVR